MNILLLAQYTIVTIVIIYLCAALLQRVQLSLAKSPGLGGHLRWAKRFARVVRSYTYDEKKWLDIDGAPASIVAKRNNGFQILSQTLRERSPKTLAYTAQAKSMLSDMQLTSRYRVPFQFREIAEKNLKMGYFFHASQGVWLKDLDDHAYIDVSGSYGVNLFGQDFYKQCIEEGSSAVHALGPLLGGYHPCVLDNARRITEISGLDEVTFHMSGTEAVMQAVRVARYQTRRNKIVRFTSAYHGWWDDVQPGPGNPMPPSPDTLTLRDMHANTLRVLRKRRDIACVLINPIQAMHPNRAAPTDSMLVDGARHVQFDRLAYTTWLKAVREVCTERGIVLIFDEVFMGFRLALGGAQAYFGIQADMVTYGKTLGGGFPIGVLCGRAALMKRFNDDRPADLCFARGTFNAHPYVMGAMNSFLQKLDQPDVRETYAALDQTWIERCEKLNAQLKEARLPVRLDAMSTVWSVLYDVPSRYNWMLQYYLRKEGIVLSWVGTGRLIFNFGFTDDDFDTFSKRFIAAAHSMQNDGWWWTPVGQTNKNIKRSVARELIKTLVGARLN